MKKILTIVCLLILCCMVPFSMIWGETLVTPLDDLESPDSITVHKDRVYIADGATVNIYTLTGNKLKFKKKFGRAGEGPQEFKISSGEADQLTLSIHQNQLIIYSIGRLSFFSLDGEYKKEIQVPIGRNLRPLGNGFVGYTSPSTEKILYVAFNLYDGAGNKIKEIFRKEYYVQPHKKFNLVYIGCGNKRRAVFNVYGNNVFIEGNDNKIHVFDEKGNPAYKIPLDYQRLPITAAHKKTIQKDLQTLFKGRIMRQLIKKNGFFSDTFPARMFTVSNGKIYIPTYRQKKGKTQFMIYDTKGKRLNEIYLPFEGVSLLFPTKYTFANDALFQFHDNEEEETWELRITGI